MSRLHDEQLIPVREIPKRVCKREGKDISVQAAYRWVRRGLAGVKLEAIYHAGVLCTSIEALERFDDRVTQARCGKSTEQAPPTKAANERMKLKLRRALA